MAEQAALLRQWLLLRILSARRYGATLKEMAVEMQVSEKTIRRDLETFVTAGFPLLETVGEFGRKLWHLDADKVQPGMTFAFDEALALYLGRHLLEPLAGTPFWDAAQRAFKKVRASLGESALKYVERFADTFRQTAFGRHDYADKSAVIDRLMIGIEDCRAVFITYQSLRATEPVTYDVYPYGLAYHRGSLYLVGRKVERAPSRSPRGGNVAAAADSAAAAGSDADADSDADELRHWKVDRIVDAEATQFRFQRPAGFDLQQHLAGSFGIYHGDGAAEVRIRVRFTPAVARYVQESQWHASQKLTKEKDGSLLAEFHLADTAEIKRWLMSFGQHATVLEPKQLRQEIVAELKTLLAAYGRSTITSPGKRPG